ncbi:MAG TPA: hypothetical protein DIT99_21520 [Candidatus Latescibacteria bacterium]|nr:hypothetical protein [Candidatus Latescibacterota bacterium]
MKKSKGIEKSVLLFGKHRSLRNLIPVFTREPGHFIGAGRDAGISEYRSSPSLTTISESQTYPHICGLCMLMTPVGDQTLLSQGLPSFLRYPPLYV